MADQGYFWKAFAAVCLTISLTLNLEAQTSDTSSAAKKWEVRGYVKNLQTLQMDKNFENLITGNLIHNRINVRWNPSSKITAGVEFRNRFYWGEQVRLTPGFAAALRNPNEAVNMSILWMSTTSMAFQTTIDRIWLEYRTDRWNIRAGRQRLNWGMCTFWNPNDIFNTYNFLDFDYEERPGRDAVRLVYKFGSMSNLEVAGAAADRASKSVVAAKYFTNQWNYDFQFSGGVFHEKLSLGAGWSGSIGKSGFKGELQYFSPHRDTTAQINAALESDYVLGKGWYLNAGFLYNSAGIYKPVSDWNQVSFVLSPQHLMPTKWNPAFTMAKTISPLLSVNFAVIYAPGTNVMIALPSLKYNLATNIDFDLIGQSFFAEQNNRFDGVARRLYLRLKWSF